MPAGGARVRVTFQVDADGLLAVAAREMSTGIEASVTVKPSYGLSDDEIARMLQESIGAAEEDMLARALREQQVEAQRLVEATRAALAADGDLLQDEERAAIEALLSATVAAAGEDTATIKAAVERLAHGTEEFAARRMDRNIRAALAGRRVDDIVAE
jgi:molecular chaperone HscA